MKFNDITRGNGLETHGISNANLIYWTAPTSVLYEQIVERCEGLLSHLGAVAVKTGHYTGRAANEKFIVDEPTCHDNIAWGKVNRPFEPAKFDGLYTRMCAYMHGRDLFVQEGRVKARYLPLLLYIATLAGGLLLLKRVLDRYSTVSWLIQVIEGHE